MKFFLLTLLALLAFSPHVVFAQQGIDSNGNVLSNGSVVAAPSPAASVNTNTSFVPLAPIPGLTTGAVATSAGTANFLKNLYVYLIGLAAVLAVVEIIWGGLEIATKDSVSKKSDGKKRIWQALMGLALVLSPALVFGIINPAILNMSVAMAPLNVQNSTGYAPAVTQTVITRTTANNDQAAMAQVAQSEDDCKKNQHGTPKLTGAPPNIVVTCTANTVLAPGVTQVSSAACKKLTNGQPLPSGGSCANQSGQVQTLIRFNGYACADLAGGGVCLHSQ